MNEDVTADRYLVAAPIGTSGMALIGDTGQFVTLGKKRVTALADEGGDLQVSLAFAAGEKSRTLQGYSPDRPTVTAWTGTAGAVAYDPATGRFTVEAMPGRHGVASLWIRRARGGPGGRHRDTLGTPDVQ